MNDPQEGTDEPREVRLAKIIEMLLEGGNEISEESSQSTLERWREVADLTETPEQLQQFVGILRNQYTHDYGTICHAAAAAAVAAVRCVDRGPTGGLTGFQAGAVMWEFIKLWLHEKGPLSLIRWDKMLYPQYEDQFAGNSIPEASWKRVVELAQEALNPQTSMAGQVREHMLSIAEGVLPWEMRLRAE